MAAKRSIKKSVKTPTSVPVKAHRRELHVLSDSTGNLARHMLAAFLTQFKEGTFDVRVHPFLEKVNQIESDLNGINADAAVVMHALVEPDSKQTVEKWCKARGVPCRDLTGGFVEFLSQAAAAPPTPNRDRLHIVDDTYRARISALEFTINHDDGLGTSSLVDADIVLVGVSRTSKTPTSIYLAEQGYKVANVSLAYGVEPPKELMEMGLGKVVGFVIDPMHLVEIRRNRNREWRMADTRYNDPAEVDREVNWSRTLYRRQGWPIIDVSDQAVEETAARVLDVLNLRRK